MLISRIFLMENWLTLEDFSYLCQRKWFKLEVC